MAAATGTVTPIHGLKAKREALTSSERKIVKKCTEAFEEGLIDALPEMVSGIEVSGRQSSMTSTTVLKKAKGPNISVKVHPRVRAPREGVEFEVHITDDRQLELGWLDVEEDEDDLDPVSDEEFPDEGFED